MGGPPERGGPPEGGPMKYPGCMQVSESQGEVTNIKCQEGCETVAVPDGGDQWLFRIQQQQIVGGQQALRLSVWRASETTKPSTAAEGASLKRNQNGSGPQQQSACNFYFRLPCELPSLKLLGASLTMGGEPRANEVSEAKGKERSHEIRLSLHCTLRPGSLSEALQDKEDRSVRSLTAFRLTCKSCGECLAQLTDATICILPSALWTEAQGAAACEECASSPPFSRDFHAKPGRRCVLAVLWRPELLK
ncbi:hypothetical protein Emed_004613 [Eimeria media]